MRRKYRGSKQPGYTIVALSVIEEFECGYLSRRSWWIVSRQSLDQRKKNGFPLSLSPRHSSREKGAATRLTLPWFPARFTEFPQTSPVLSLFPLPECISLRLARFDARHASPHCPRFVLLRETTIKRRHASRTRNINHRFSNEISFRTPSAAVPTCHFATLRIFNE